MEYLGDSMEASKLLIKNIDLSEQKKSSFLGGNCLLTAGTFYSELGEHEMAINYLSKALLIFRRYEGTEWTAAVGKTQIVLGSVYHQLGDYSTALKCYLEAKEIMWENNDYKSFGNVVIKIRDCYHNMKKSDA